MNLNLYMVQRLSALVMVPLVLGHIIVMIYAVQGGLSAAEILGRTQGSIWWALYYGAFVLAAAVHGALGLRVIFSEWFDLSKMPHPEKGLNLFTLSVFLTLAMLGLLAVYGVVVS